jgi:hypothetical protein
MSNVNEATAQKVVFQTALTDISATDLEGAGNLRWVGDKCYRWVLNGNATALTVGQLGFHKAGDAEGMNLEIYDLATAGAANAGLLAGIVQAASLTAEYYGWVQVLGPYASAALYAYGADADIAAGDLLKGSASGGYLVRDRGVTDVAATQAVITDSTGGVASTTLAALTNLNVLTDSSGGAASTTIPAVTNLATLTDSTGGTTTTTFAAIAATANYLQGDLTAIKDALAGVAAELAKQKAANVIFMTAISQLIDEQALQYTFNASVKVDIAELATEVNAAGVDISALLVAQSTQRYVIALEALASSVTVATAARVYVNCL